MSIRTSKLAPLALGLAALVAAPAPAKWLGLAKKGPPIDYPATPPATPRPPSNGAIFQASNGYVSLHEGARARRVGDMLTILLVERTVAQKAVESKSGRDGNIGLTPPVTGPLSLFSPGDVAASGNQAFDGRGSAAQSNSLFGDISVTVAEVFPNGTMLVRGQKLMTLNRGEEWVQIQGIVRIADIDLDNRVLSSRVADARITYAGRGDIQRQSRPGWLQRFFSLVSPF